MYVFVMICDTPPWWHKAAVTCVLSEQDTHRGGFMTEGMARLYLSDWLLTVNMKLLFSKHSSGKGNLCLSVCVCLHSCRSEIQSEGWERCWEWRQTTHHLIMLECATTLCIFLVALVIGVVIVQTVRTERVREGLTGGMRVWRGEEIQPLFEVSRFVKNDWFQI